jgi:formate hydrogenlyase subunit 3/multisubunit Na+/H+ antiporter MnhD subunit
MTEYVEPSLKARQLFFLAVILLGGFALFISRLDELLPYSEPDQMRDWALIAMVLSTIFFTALSVVAIYYTRRAVQSGQWPAKGMAVPFRTKIKVIKNPRNAWLLLTVILCYFAFKIAFLWFMYVQQRQLDEEIQQLIVQSEEQIKKYGVQPNLSVERDAAKARRPSP